LNEDGTTDAGTEGSAPACLRHRSDANVERNSWVKMIGCSHAAK